MALPWTMWVVSSITLAVSAVSLPTMSNQLDTSLVYEDEYITGTQIFDGYARNVSLLYKNCTFDTGSVYGISFVHTSGFSPANEDIQNTTIVFDHCTFVTSVAAVYASRAHISLLHIEFVSSPLLGDNESSDPCVDIEIGAIQAEYMNNSLFDLRDLSIVMTNTSLTSAAPVAYISTNSSLIPSIPVSFIGVSFLAQDSFLNPNFDLINSDFSIVNVTLLRVTLISNRLLGTSSGCNNITVTVIDSNITETFDTIVRVRPGRHQLFHFHNSNLTLSDQRYFNDSGSVFTFVSGVDVYGCAAEANHQLLCEEWDYSVSPTSSVITPCSYERFISDYPCSGHSFHTCNTAVGSCTASAAFNTTIVGQLLLSSQGGFASTLLNASRLGGDCSLHSFRLILQADESDVLRPSLPPAQVGFVVCNATGCSPEQVRRGNCAPCPSSTTLASWNVNVTAQGNLFSLVNEEIFSNLDSTTVITLFIEAQDGSDAFDGIDIMVQLQASCYGACLAPCTTRDDIEFRFTGITFLNVQHVENTERVLTHVQGASNVRFVFDGATIYGGLPIWVDDSVIGNVSVTATSASLNFVDDSFVQVSSMARTPHGVVNVDMSDSTLRLELSGTTLIPGTSPVSSVVQWNHQGDDAVFQMSFVRVEVLVSDLPSPLIGDKATFSLLSTQHTDLIWKQSVTLTMRQSSLVDAGSIGNINPAGVTVVCFNDSSISPGSLLSWSNLTWQRLAQWQRGTLVGMSMIGCNVTVGHTASPLIAISGNSTSPSTVHYWMGGSSIVLVGNTINVQVTASVADERLLSTFFVSAKGFRGVIGATVPIIVSVATITVNLNVTSSSNGFLDVLLHRVSFLSFQESILQHVAFRINDTNLMIAAASNTTVISDPNTNHPLTMLLMRNRTSSRWSDVAIVHAPLVSGALSFGSTNIVNVTSVLAEVGRDEDIFADGQLEVSDLPRTTFPAPGRPLVVNRILADGCDILPCTVAAHYVRINVTASCVAEAALSASAMINSTITLHNVLNDQGAAIVVGNASNCAVTLLSSFFLQLPSAQLASSGANFAPVWMRNATDVTVWYGCLDVSKTGQYLVAPFNVAGVSFHQTTSCTPYSSGCSLGPSRSTSTSKPLSATFSFERSRSLLSTTPSLSLSRVTRSSNTQSHASRTRTFSKSPTKSEDTMSRTSPHHSPTATASHTTKLAFIPTDLFASVDTVCPDAVIAVGLTAVTIPVQYVQTHTLWIRFNVSDQYASSLFSSPHDMSLTAQGDSLLTDVKPLLQNDVGNRCVWLRLGPIDYNPYEPRAFEFVVGPNPLIVSPLVGTINIQLIISPRTTTVAPAVSSGIATATGVVSLITMNTITSGSQSRAQMLLSLTACTYAADNEAYSFLGIGIGDVAAYYYRGAIVGNSLLVLLVLCVGLTVIFVVSLSSAKNKFSFWTDESFQAAGAMLFSTVHVPGLMMVPLTLLLQPTVSSSVALFMVGDGDAGDIILGIVGVAICLCALAYVSSTILFFRPPSQQLFVGVRPTGAPLDSDDEEKGGVKGQPHHRNPSPYYSSSRSRMSTIVDEWIVPPIHWVTVTPSAKAWKRRHLQMFCDNDTAWFTALGVMSDFSVAVFNGIATGGNGSVCLVQLVVMTILYAVQGVLLVFNAPTLGRLAHVLISFSCTMSLFCAVLILAATATSDQASKTVCIDAANMLGTIINVAGLIQNMPLLVEAGLGVPRMLRRLWNARRTLERQRVPPMLHVMSLNDDMPTSTPDELLLSPQHGVHHNEMLDTEDVALEMVNQNSAAGGASPVVEQLTTTEQETPEAAQAPVPPPPKPSTEYFYNESLAGGLGPALRETEKAKQAMVLGDDGLNSGLDMLRTMRSNTDDDVIEL